MNIYKEELLDHYKYPRNQGVIDNPDIAYKSGNPACGDTVSFTLNIENEKISNIKFQGSGCVISQAVASMLTEKVLGSSVENIINMTKDDILGLINISLGPTRLRCALLALEALQMGIKNYLEKIS